jgi:radical SAM superfamily enzyme YgiQ (UPF0313 family)
MLTLINVNRMKPAIGPLGLDYIACTARQAGIETDILDLCFTDDITQTLKHYFSRHNPYLVGISLRNSDDCFWPSGQWFIPDLAEIIKLLRGITDAPVVLGGVGFSIFPERILEYTGADFGIHGDGEQAIISLLRELKGSRDFEKVDGLIWQENGKLRKNEPAWPKQLSLPVSRDAVDNKRYFNEGGQCGLETKRGCNRQCIYCADPLAKGTQSRLRAPAEVADEVQALLNQGIDVLHLCDAEFNIPRQHTMEICNEFIARQFSEKLRWYTYMAVLPFDAELAGAMRKAGCVGINFTGDSACTSMLEKYRQVHRRNDIASAVKLCRENNIKVMIDLLLGGPGETPETVKETIDFIKEISPDCAGAALGIRIYPGTEMARIVESEGIENNQNIRRHYEGGADFFRPTFYISSALGQQTAELVRDIIAGDQRFFEPMPELQSEDAPTDHNYNDNTQLVEAIAQGARGAYWDILHQLRTNG